MSHHDYEVSKRILAEDYPFHALIMAAIRQADTFNGETLRKAFPETFQEMRDRYNSPGGLLPDEKGARDAEAARTLHEHDD